jgi:DNA-damage-inducible protein D
MKTEIQTTSSSHVSPFERIRRTNDAGVEYWSSRDFAQVLQYNEYRNFEQVIQKARAACFNSGQRLEDHFVDVTEMVELGRGAQREVKTVYLSRYACYIGNLKHLRLTKFQKNRIQANSISLIKKPANTIVGVHCAKKDQKQSARIGLQCGMK